MSFSNPEPREKNVKNPGIQFLRAVAVLAVIVFHLDHSLLPGGFVGVDIFFVISGFVITQSLIRNWHSNLLSFLGIFYARRVFRILPALLVFLAVVSLMVAVFVPRGFFLGGDGPQTGMWAVFGLSNFSLFFADRGYFDERIEFNAFSHTWSLGVEEQFYLVFPLLLWAIWLVASKGRAQFRNALLIGLLSVPFVMSLAWAAVISFSEPLAGFYLLPSRFWELGVGALTAVALPRLSFFQRIGAPATHGLMLVGALLVVLAVTTTTRDGFPFPGALMPVIGTVLLLVAFHKEIYSPNRFLSWQPFQIVGNWSYSLYLWHWAVIVLMRWTIGLQYWWHYVIALVVTFVVAGLSFRFIEQPFIRLGKEKSFPHLKVLATTGVVSLLWFGSLWVGDRAAEPIISQSVTAQRVVFAPPEGTQDPKVRYAEFEALGEGHTVFVIGDSHAGHLGTLLTELRAVMGFDYRLFDDRNCEVAPLTAPRSACDEWEDFVSAVNGQAEPGDIVLLSSLRIPRISSLIDGQRDDVENIVSQYLRDYSNYDSDLVIEESRQAISQLSKNGAVVVVPTPTPVFPSPVFRCLDWYNSANPVCDGGFRVEASEIQRAALPVYTTLQALELEGLVTTWDTFSVLCPGATCDAAVDGRYLVYDGDHLSDWGNYLLMPGFVEILDRVWGDASGLSPVSTY